MSKNAKVILPNSQLLDDVAALLADGHAVTLRAKGNSMFPFIVSERDCVILQKTASVRKGDIVLAHLRTGSYVLHRIHHIEEERITLMGDGNLQGTEQCLPDDICGTVSDIIRNGHTISCHSASERRKVRIWRMLLPVRRYILYICRRLTAFRLRTEEHNNR